MARRFASSIDLTGFAILGALLDPVSSDPSGLGTGDKGRIWYNITSSPPQLKIWNGTAAIDVMARANATGTQTASTISDLATVVQAYSLSAFAAPTGDLSVGSHKLTNVTDPGSAQDAATKNYIDTALAGLASGQVLKGAVKVATSANVANPTGAPGSTIDGVTMGVGDVFLLMGNTTGSQNGPYVWASSTSAARATNWDTSGEASLGSYWIVEQGTNADTFALLTNDSAVTLGTTALTFVVRGAAGATYSVNGGLTLSGTAISVNPGTGILAASGSSTTTAIDTSLVVRKVGGAVPATTGGIFSVSGANVTVNHALSNSNPELTVTAGGTPASGYTAGKPVEVDWSVTDANNLLIAFPGAPATGNWVVGVQG